MTTRTTMHPFKILAAVGVAFVMWGLVLACASSPAWAAEITVNTTANEQNTAIETARSGKRLRRPTPIGRSMHEWRALQLKMTS